MQATDFRTFCPKWPDLPLALSMGRERIDVAITLRSGQAFCWRSNPTGNLWQGWIGEYPCQITITDAASYFYTPAPTEKIERYFGLGTDLEAILASFPQDPWLPQAIAFAPGLRVLEQEPWETLASFICSAVKQIPQIEQINQALRRTLGSEIAPGLFTFPTAAAMAVAGEEALRRCKLGFRARGLYRTACRIAEGEMPIPFSIETLRPIPTDALRQNLIEFPGVGPKIADCVLLFAYRRYDAFPIDVWVERILRNLYFKKRRSIPNSQLLRFTQTYFGPFPGYAQQYLFHWVRTARPAEAFSAPTKKRKQSRSIP